MVVYVTLDLYLVTKNEIDGISGTSASSSAAMGLRYIYVILIIVTKLAQEAAAVLLYAV